MTFSQHVKALIAEAVVPYGTPDLSQRSVLIGNMVFLYHVIKASENLLAVAAQQSEGDLKAYLVEHLEEERQHEKWLGEDLSRLGVDVTKTIVPRLAVELAGSQYYLIYHVHPAALLGYMALLEGNPMPLDHVEALEGIHGKEALTTLRYHTEHDPDHGAELMRIIDEQPEHLRPLIVQSAVQSAYYFGAAMRALV